ncbi:MAG: hypothetical protein AAGJ40_10490 [Planctomycetota bacterium]
MIRSTARRGDLDDRPQITVIAIRKCCHQYDGFNTAIGSSPRAGVMGLGHTGGIIWTTLRCRSECELESGCVWVMTGGVAGNRDASSPESSNEAVIETPAEMR